ncbi:hypothetical protein OAF54_01215 [bacterium]|nr:hypothetical protein [bacterium]
MAQNVYTSTNILLGAAARIQIGADGTYNASNCPSVGYTKGDVVLTITTTYAYKEPDQSRGRVGAKCIEERAQLTVPMDELTLNNLALACGYPAGSVAAGVFSFGGSATTTIYDMWLVGDGPNSTTRTVAIFKAVPDGDKAYPLKKAEESVLEVTFELFLDDTLTAGAQMLTITDV